MILIGAMAINVGGPTCPARERRVTSLGQPVQRLLQQWNHRFRVSRDHRWQSLSDCSFAVATMQSHAAGRDKWKDVVSIGEDNLRKMVLESA
jgi:hypothetical protein